MKCLLVINQMTHSVETSSCEAWKEVSRSVSSGSVSSAFTGIDGLTGINQFGPLSCSW